TGGPWLSVADQAAMDLVAPGMWDEIVLDTAVLGTLTGTYDVIWLEGGDFAAGVLEAFMTTNQLALQNWVSAGGRLYINSAPNIGANQSWGFGGSVLTYPGFTSGYGGAVDGAHRIWSAPFQPTIQYW